MLESPEYQKTRMFLDTINQELLERVKADEDDMDSEDDNKDDKEDEDEDMKDKTDESYVTQTVRSRAQKLSVPESWINSTLAKIRVGEDDREELKAELQTRYDLNESQASWLLLEGEEDKAEIIMATKDMVDRITGWLEDVAAMKAEQLLELMDSIREQQGSDVAQQYQDAVKPALEAIYTALETSRTGLSSGLAVVSGGEAPTMGGGAPTMGGGAPMGGATPPVGGEEMGLEEPIGGEAGREQRESVNYSRRLGMLLNSKKK